MAAKIYLPVITEIDDDAQTLVFKKGTKLSGHDPDENLACGSCKTVLAKNMSTLDLRKLLDGSGRTNQIVLKCGCGALMEVRPKLVD